MVSRGTPAGLECCRIIQLVVAGWKLTNPFQGVGLVQDGVVPSSRVDLSRQVGSALGVVSS
jgi:hypothetical protein